MQRAADGEIAADTGSGEWTSEGGRKRKQVAADGIRTRYPAAPRDGAGSERTMFCQLGWYRRKFPVPISGRDFFIFRRKIQ